MSQLSKKISNHLGGQYYWFRRKLGFYIRDEAAFRSLLEDVGIRAGGVVFLHSSMDRIIRSAPWIGPFELIEILLDMVGKKGTLLMPTIPFLGKQFDYIETNRSFDPVLTPSRMGIVSELFRRRSDVLRSLHPTHSVAAWGSHAEALVRDHHKGTAFGINSPFYRTCEHDGVVVGLGVDGTAFTLIHVPEELHKKTCDLQYDKHPVTMTINAVDGDVEYPLFPLRGDLTRDYSRVWRILHQEAILFRCRHRGLLVASTKANEFVDRSLQLIEANRFYG